MNSLMWIEQKEKFKAHYLDLVKDRHKGALVALFSFVLLLASYVYGFFVRLILSCYQTGLASSDKPDCRVISVGNITWGGTGKTPLVETIVKFLQQKGKKPAILIRGYGQDEVYMLQNKFKDIAVLAGGNRLKTAQEAIKRYGADTIVLDDGFQHWQMDRDLDIVLIDVSLPFGNKKLIPRGILREPLSSLRRADMFVLTKTELAQENIEPVKKELRKYNPKAPIYEAAYLPYFLRNLTSDEKFELLTIKDQNVAVVCGIAAPESFIKTVDSLGVKIGLSFCFPDHYQYSRGDLLRIEKTCLENQIKILLTTEKDAARLTVLLKSVSLKVEFLTVGIEVKIIKDEEKFFGFILGNEGLTRPYSILILSDAKAGHLNQSFALANIIKKIKIERGVGLDRINTKIVEVEFKHRLCRMLLYFSAFFSDDNCRRCLRCLAFCLKKHSFGELMQSTADIIVSAGSSLSCVNLFLSYRNKARKIIIMKPAILNLDKFNLVIIPEHDRVKIKDNILLTRIAPNLIERQYLQEKANILKKRLQAQSSKLKAGRPTIGVLIGGDTKEYRLTIEFMNEIIPQLKQATESLNGQMLVTTSRRTPKPVEQILKENLTGFSRCKLLIIANENNIPEAVGGILGLSDIIVVSGESISMVSEAVSAEKYVLVFNLEKKLKTKTKQERFLEKLENEGMLKVIQAQDLPQAIERIWQQRPEVKKIQDRALIYQAVKKIL